MTDFIFSKDERDIFNEVLDEQERTRIQYFVEDEALLEAVKKALLLPMYDWGTLKKSKKPRTDTNYVNSYLQLDDVKLGAQIRATANGMFFIEKGFALLKTLKKQEENKVEDNNESPTI